MSTPSSFPNPQHPQRYPRPLSSEEEFARDLQDESLRIADDPAMGALAAHRLLDPNDPEVAELWKLKKQEARARAQAANDPFWASYPPPGALPKLGVGRLPLLALRTSQVLSLDLGDACMNVLLVGFTGAGKTSALRILASSVPQGAATILLWDRKGDFTSSESLEGIAAPLILGWQELKIAFLQPPPGVGIREQVNRMVEVLASHLHLQASRRLMMESLDQLFKRRRPEAEYPTLSEWLSLLKAITPKSALSRQGQYHEALNFALLYIHRCLGSIINYASSNLWDRIFAHRGVVVIRTTGLPVEMETLLVCLAANWAYESRAYSDPRILHPILTVVDDALPLVVGGHGREAGGEINPLSQWAFMGRARRLGIIASAQNYFLVSPALKNNCATILCCGSSGRDARELALDLNLTKEQAAMLPVLRPGEAIALARTVWPKALYGRIPHLT